jgi:hypothetical protein
VLEGLRGEDSIAELCRKEGMLDYCPRLRELWVGKSIGINNAGQCITYRGFSK